MGGLSSKPSVAKELQALLNSRGSLNVKDVKMLYSKATFVLKDASVPTKDKETVKGLLNELVKRFNKSYHSLIADAAQEGGCPQVEIVAANGADTCYSVHDLTAHWKSQHLKWTEGEYPSVYTIPKVTGHVILKEDVNRVLGYYSSSPSPAAIKWFLMPIRSRVRVHDDEADTTTTMELCMLVPSTDQDAVQRQLEAEDALTKLRFIEGGGQARKPIRTDDALWERVKRKVVAEAVAGTAAGAWSARKAQLAVKRYKDAGGDFIGKKSENNALVKWTRQDWTTKSGRPSHVTGERYLPRRVLEHLSPKEYNATTRAKREGTRKGKQYVAQPKALQEKTKKYT
jgi:hypothetical protein